MTRYPFMPTRLSITSQNAKMHSRSLRGKRTCQERIGTICVVIIECALGCLGGSGGWTPNCLRSGSRSPWFELRIGLCADSSQPGTCFEFCVSLSLCPSLLMLCGFPIPRLSHLVSGAFLKSHQRSPLIFPWPALGRNCKPGCNGG